MLNRRLASTALALVACSVACSSSTNSPSTNGGAENGGAVGQAGAQPSPGGTTGNSGGSSYGGSVAGDGSVPVAGASAAGASTAGGGAPNGGSAGKGASGGATNGGASNGGAMSGGAGPGASGAAGAGTASVRVVGRTAPGTNGSQLFSWSGVNFNARFTGTQVSMDVSDGTNKNRFTVVVDGGAPKTVATVAGQNSLVLATGLAAGTHELVVWRNTEASIGVSTFVGLSNFGPGGALVAPPAAPDRRIEVIGDSLSAGAGVEGNAACPGGIDLFTNNYLAYGSVAARAVNADVVTIAWSGIGVYRNYSGTGPTMPARYDFSVPNTNTAWDFSKYQPQVVVINLGTNDFGMGDPGQPYVDAYVNFAKHVRTKYSTANFILIDMYGGNRLTAINSVVTALKASGEMKVETLSVSSAQNNLGCGQHPNVVGQQAMGAVLATRLKSLMGW